MPSEAEYNKMTVDQLKAELKKRKLATSGKKKALITRLLKAQEEQADAGTTEPATKKPAKPSKAPATVVATTDKSNGDKAKTSANEESKSDADGSKTVQIKPSGILESVEKQAKENSGLAEALSQEEKRKQRAERFGIPYKPGKTALKVAAEEEKNKRLERAKRFQLASKELELEKKRKRAERFGVVDADVEEDKRKKRMERFGKAM